MQDYLRGIPPAALRTSVGRRTVASRSPMHMALIYLRHHMRGHDGTVSLAEPHREWSELATQLRDPCERLGFRHVFVAPRECAKTTWWYLFIPLWCAAFGHRRFINAFSSSSEQARMHLRTFKNELDTNQLLRRDFPTLCSPAKRSSGTSLADRASLYIAASGFAFGAYGINTNVLGMKIGNMRPDMLILDDIEPDEARNSPEIARQRLGTLRDAILPLNERAAVVLVGTVTMPESIVHQCVLSVLPGQGRGAVQSWIAEERFKVHYHLPLMGEGENIRSIWPGKWSVEYLLSRVGTRTYAKNFLNQPQPDDGVYWVPALVKYGRLESPNITLLSIDPQVSDSKTSDYTGLCVVRYATDHDAFDVPHAEQTRLRGEELRLYIEKLISTYGVTAVVIETNQGGSLWTDKDIGLLRHVRCNVLTVHQSAPKSIRAAQALREYEEGRVRHGRVFQALETQMFSFPRVLHDDIVDALSTGINTIRKRVGMRESTRPIQSVWVR